VATDQPFARASRGKKPQILDELVELTGRPGPDAWFDRLQVTARGSAMLAALALVVALGACDKGHPAASASTSSVASSANRSLSTVSSSPSSMTPSPLGSPESSAATAPPLDPTVVQAVGSETAYCAVVRSGQVYCWGAVAGSATPVAVKDVGGGGELTGAAKVVRTNDGAHCALLQSGGVDCWGPNTAGERGIGEPAGQTALPDSPTAVVGVGGNGRLTGVADLVAGRYGVCAILTSSGVDCWGNNTAGQLGDGTLGGASATPVAVVGIGGPGTLTGVTSLAAASGPLYDSSFCAVLTTGRVACWGNGSDGQLGNTATANSAIPIAAGGALAGVQSIAGGYRGYCAVLTNGGVVCWGPDTVGQLGTGHRCPCPPAYPPAQVPGVSGAKLVVASPASSYCAVGSASVMCWGQGDEGELGNGSSGNRSTPSVPVTVAGTAGHPTLTGVATLVAGLGRTYCAVLDSHGAVCWGSNVAGLLGVGTSDGPQTCLTIHGRTPCAVTPVAVKGIGGQGTLSDAASLVAGGNSFCAITTTGQLDCWGSNDAGQLGNGTNTGSTVPVRITIGP
jgi:alpha-tubulin suppressor-like RCC1 family protein